MALTRRLSFLTEINWKLLFAPLALMAISLVTIAMSESGSLLQEGEELSLVRALRSAKVLGQLRWQVIGWISFFLVARFDYHHLREWTWFLYLGAIVALVGLFFVEPIANVYRWYRIPFLGMSLQPAEYAKLIAVMAMAWYLEQNKSDSAHLMTAMGLFLIVAPIFFLILIQPDLGGALVLIPMVAALMSFGRMHRGLFRVLFGSGFLLLSLCSLIFVGLIDHEQMRPFATQWMKEYQYERLSPDNYHQNACQNAISLGGLWGRGFEGASYTQGGWLPEASTDAIFAAWVEMTGLVGALAVLVLFALLLHEVLAAALVAKDSFGQLLTTGICVYLAAHVIVNIGMICALIPMTGVPLPLMSYGGSSVLSNMIALGIVQSVYSKRFLF